MSQRDQRWAAHRQELETAAQAAGIDVDVMVKIAGFESGFNPDARPIATSDPSRNTVRQYDGTMAISSAHGYGQFLNGTWADMINRYGEKYGVENAAELTRTEANAPALREDTALQAAMLAEFTRENIERASQYGGADVAANVYAMHNLGATDGARFLEALRDNPDARVDRVLSRDVIAGNPALYGSGDISLQAAYAGMGRHMDQYQGYAEEAVRGLPSGTLSAGGPTRGARDPLADGMLSIDERGEPVERLQEQLGALGYTGRDGQPLTADGVFGGNTQYAVERFQQDRGLAVDGIAGRDTLQALQVEAQAPQQPVPGESPAPGMVAPAPAPATPDGGAGDGIVLNRAYELTMQFDHVKYGFGDKHPERGTVDCSGWVVRLANQTMDEINEQAGRTVFPADQYYRPNYDAAANIVQKAAARSGVMIEGGNVTADVLREGMIIGEDNGDKKWDRGRFNGIDHITMVVRDPTDGELKISQSRSREGVELIPLDQYLEQKNARGARLFATDPLAAARDLIQEQEAARGETAPRAPAVPRTSAPGDAARPTLREDSRGSGVQSLQETLNTLGYTDRAGRALETDSIFGQRTEEAVKAFQRDKGLSVDGIVGPDTHAALDRAREQARADAAPGQSRDAAPADPARAGQAAASGGFLSSLFDAARGNNPDAFRDALAGFSDSAAGRAFAQLRDSAQEQLAAARDAEQQQKQGVERQ